MAAATERKYTMKQSLILIGLLLMGSCVGKHKFSQAVRESNKTHMTSTSMAHKQYHSQRVVRQSDSSTHQYWLKIYPKGDLNISDGMVRGQADSILWYGDIRISSKKSNWQQQQANEQQENNLLKTETTVSEKKTAEKDNLTAVWWPIVLVSVIWLWLVHLKVKLK